MSQHFGREYMDQEALSLQKSRQPEWQDVGDSPPCPSWVSRHRMKERQNGVRKGPWVGSKILTQLLSLLRQDPGDLGPGSPPLRASVSLPVKCGCWT